MWSVKLINSKLIWKFLALLFYSNFDIFLIIFAVLLLWHQQQKYAFAIH